MNDVGLHSPEGPSAFDPAPRERNLLPWIVAAVTVMVLIGVAFLLAGHSSQPTASQASPYVAKLALSDVKMSQATNFAGSQLTYIDGKITNHGSKTVTKIVVQALFATDSGDPPQAEEVPFTLIRTREPYVDTLPLSAMPLAPGASQEFRMVYDDISPMWNQQVPELKILSVTTRP